MKHPSYITLFRESGGLRPVITGPEDTKPIKQRMGTQRAAPKKAQKVAKKKRR